MKKLQWMFSAILFCGLTFTSCSKEDNEIPVPEQEEQQETIYKAIGGVNNFNLVPANEGDPEVVAALKSIANVADIKPFMNVYLGQAYYFNYIQPVDHENPSAGTFKQQVVLTFAGKNAPVILHTQGYSLQGDFGSYTNRLDSISAPDFVYSLSEDPKVKFDVNCVQVEYRYHGFSLPEGDTDNYKYLNAKQHSADLHNIVKDLKKVLFTGKWLSTGVSKNGMTTTQYAYYYPNAVEMYVPFVAPAPLQDHDIRIGQYMCQQSVKDYLPQIKAAFEALVNNEDIFKATWAAIKKKNKAQAANYEKYNTDQALSQTIATCYQDLFDIESYGNVSTWNKFIPTEKSTPEQYAEFFMLDKNDSRILDNNQANTRGVRRDPFEVQTFIDLGSLGYDYSWVLKGKLLSAAFQKTLTDAMEGFKKSKSVELEVNIVKWLETTNCKMYFVYGGDDPWTGAAIPDPKNSNVKKYIVPHGTHNDYLYTYEKFGGKEGLKIAQELLSEARKNLGMTK